MDEQDILEQNISRLVKSGGDGYVLVDNFADRLRIEALHELAKQTADGEKTLQRASDMLGNGIV